MECTHGIIDLIVGLYSAVQHEALITERRTKINGSFIKRVAKKYYPNIILALKSVDGDIYESIRKTERTEMSKLIENDIAKQKSNEQEVKITKERTKPADKDKMIKICISSIRNVMKTYSAKMIYEAASEVYKRNDYNSNSQANFNEDVYNYLSGKKVPKRRKKVKIAQDTYVNILKNENQACR